jgi:hypothetical protein
MQRTKPILLNFSNGVSDKTKSARAGTKLEGKFSEFFGQASGGSDASRVSIFSRRNVRRFMTNASSAALQFAAENPRIFRSR